MTQNGNSEEVGNRLPLRLIPATLTSSRFSVEEAPSASDVVVHHLPVIEVEPASVMQLVPKRRHHVVVVYADRNSHSQLLTKRAWRSLTRSQRQRWTISWYSLNDLRRGVRSWRERLSMTISGRLAQDSGGGEASDNQAILLLAVDDPLDRIALTLEALDLGMSVILMKPNTFAEEVLGPLLGVTSTEANQASVAWQIATHIQMKLSEEDLAVASQTYRQVLNAAARKSSRRDLIRAEVDGTLASLRCRACDCKIQWKDTMVAVTGTSLRLALQSQWGITIDSQSWELPGVVQKFDCEICGSSTFSAAQGSVSFYRECHRSPNYQRVDSWDYEATVREIARPDSKILDFGSGKPKMLGLLSNKKASLTLLDVDPEAVESPAVPSPKVRICSSLDQLGPDERFDVIIMAHVLEHLDNPAGTLTRLRSFLSDGALVAISVPDNARMQRQVESLEWPPHHVTRFTEAGLRRLVARSGLKPIRTLRPETWISDPFDMLLFCTLGDADQLIGKGTEGTVTD